MSETVYANDLMSPTIGSSSSSLEVKVSETYATSSVTAIDGMFAIAPIGDPQFISGEHIEFKQKSRPQKFRDGVLRSRVVPALYGIRDNTQ
jgi:hypothetical protein